MINKTLRSFAIFFIILGISFSNVPFYALTGLIDSYEKTSGVVDKIWLLEQEHSGDIVDNFSSIKNFAKKLEVPKAMAAVSIRGVGAYVYGTANLTPVIPATAAAGDMMLLAYGTKPYNDAPTIDQGWLSIGSATDGTVAAGVDVGSMQTRIYYKIHTGSEVNPTVTNGTNNVSSAVIIAFQKAANETWVTPVGAGGGDATAGTGFSVTASANPGITAGDMLVGYAAIRSDGGTQSAIGITATGLTVGAFTEFPATDGVTTLGGDMAMSGGYGLVTAGTASAAPVYASTLAVAHTGSAFIVRLRVTPAVTTITNFVSAEPGISTIAPNASGMVDSFGFATDAGTDTVTAATVGLAAGMGQYIQTVAITNDGDTVTYCSAAPSGDTASLSSCTIPVTTTNTQFKIKLTAKAHASMPAPAGGSYAVTATVTAFTSTNGQAGTDSGSSTLTIDNASPGGTTGAGATSGENAQSAVSWTNPGDGDFQQVYIYCKTSSLLSGEAPAEGTDPVVDVTACDATARMKYKGAVSPQTITGLTNGTPYYFRIYARDTNGNFTAYSATQEVMSTPSAPSNTLTISQTAGSKVATKNSGDVDQYAHDMACTGAGTCSAFTLASAGGTTNVTSIKITESGTVTANTELSDLNLYYDYDGNWADAGAETLFGTAAAFAADQTATILGTLAISAGATAYIYVRYDLANGVTYPVGGATVNFQITASGDVVSDATESGTGALAGTQTLKPQITSYTNSTESGLNYAGACTGCGARIGGGSGFRQTVVISGYGFGADPGLGSRDTVTNKVEVAGAATTMLADDASVNTNVSAWSNTSITIRTDTTIVGNADADWGTNFGGATALKVTAGGQAVPTNLNFYVFPQVVSVSGVTADQAREYDAGDTDGVITLNGTRFGTAATGGFVRILGCDATTCSSPSGTVAAVADVSCDAVDGWANTCIKVQVPVVIANNLYTGSITMQQGTGSNNKTNSYGGIRILPRITSLNPSSASISDPITVNGNHLCQSGICPGSFSVANKVTFTSGVDATVFTSWSDTAIVTAVPTGAVTGNVVVISDTSYTSNGKNFTIASAVPNNPTDLGQFKNSGLTQAIAIGGTASSTPIYLSMTMQAGMSGGTLYPQVEHKPIGTPFTCGAGACASASEGTGVAGPGPVTGSVSITPTGDIYHWQARVCHNKNGTHTASCGGTGDYPSASWASFDGGNPETSTDFKIDTTPPAVSSVSSGTPGTNSTTITWSTASEISSSQVQWNTTGTFVANCATNNDCTVITDTSPMVNSHSVTLSNLNSGTTYHYRVRSKDAAGNETIDPPTGDYAFATQAVASPAKTTRFHITGQTGTITNGLPLNKSFTVFMPELATSTKSAFVEIVGVYTTTLGSPTIRVQVNGEAFKDYALPPVSATSHFRILHQVNSVTVETANANTLTITPDTNTTIYVNSADINVNYSYTP